MGNPYTDYQQPGIAFDSLDRIWDKRFTLGTAQGLINYVYSFTKTSTNNNCLLYRETQSIMMTGFDVTFVLEERTVLTEEDSKRFIAATKSNIGIKRIWLDRISMNYPVVSMRGNNFISFEDELKIRIGFCYKNILIECSSDVWFRENILECLYR